MIKISDAELLDLWLNKNKSRDELIKMIRAEDKTLKIADARGRIERIMCRWQFEAQNKPVPKMWR